jgi:hypothetical protein
VDAQARESGPPQLCEEQQAQRYDFAQKKQKYFTGANGVAIFALTSQVLGYDEWTPEVLAGRQAKLLSALADEWSLGV